MTSINNVTPKFPVMSKSLHAELKSRVNKYLAEHAITATGNFKLFSKAIILLSLFVIIYVHLVFFTPPVFYAVLECIVFGGLIAAIGFNVMHDGSHGSFSRYAWLNNLAPPHFQNYVVTGKQGTVESNIIWTSPTNISLVDLLNNAVGLGNFACY